MLEIALVGKYIELPDAYLSVTEALATPPGRTGWTPDPLGRSEALTRENLARTAGRARPASSCRVASATAASRARSWPPTTPASTACRTSGLCLGLQCAVIEFARDVVGTADANSTEFDMFTEHPVIDYMPDQREMEDKGGTMRLGLYPARLTPGSKAAAAYGKEVIYERHRHRFEVNNRYRQTLEAAGMILSGQSPDGRLVEIVELQGSPLVRGQPVPPGVQSRVRSGRTRCSTGSWPRRWRSATVACRSLRCARHRRRQRPRMMSSSPSPHRLTWSWPRHWRIGSSPALARRSSAGRRWVWRPGGRTSWRIHSAC